MTGHTMHEADFRLADFIAALIDAGAITEPPTNEWEILRYRLEGQFSNAYRNAKGMVRLCGTGAPLHYDNFVNGRPIDAPAKRAPKVKPVSEAKKAKAAANAARRFTLYTDASCHNRTKAGAWAAILVTPDGSEHEASGPLKGEIGSSASAEIRAVANGLHHFLAKGLIPRRAIVRVVCDNVAAISNINGRKKGGSKRMEIREAARHIAGLARNHRIDVSAEWVKGHQPLAAAKDDPRVIYNRRCDRLAGEHGAILNAERKAA